MNNNLEALETIKKKLLGKKLNYKEIFALMDEISSGRMGDILTTYFVAAGFKEGFSDNELFYITKAMVETGTQLKFPGIVADKHSIGGVAGTRATMIIVPIIAAAGFTIPKTSSRAITSPAGTADVMEIFAPVTFDTKKITKIVEKVGGCIIWGGHLGIAPADDVIIRVEKPLSFESFDKVIVSIMAKKIAAGTNHLVLDIPVGKTMKITHFKDAKTTVDKFIALGKKFDINIVANISGTHEPAGNGIGPALEARDVLYVLERNEKRPLDLEKRSLKLAGMLLDICYKTAKINKNGYEEAEKILNEKTALKKFLEIIKEQGGDENVTSEKILNKKRLFQYELLANKSGTIKDINNFNLNSIAKILGAPDDKFSGLFLNKKIDNKVDKHEVICTLYSTEKIKLKEALDTNKNFPIYEIL